MALWSQILAGTLLEPDRFFDIPVFLQTAVDQPSNRSHPAGGFFPRALSALRFQSAVESRDPRQSEGKRSGKRSSETRSTTRERVLETTSRNRLIG
jgi:hypothetical protein